MRALPCVKPDVGVLLTDVSERLAPVWETLGERYEKNSNVIM